MQLDDLNSKVLEECVQDHAVFMIDPLGIVIGWNNSAESVKGYTSEEVIGKHFSLFYSAEEIDNDRPAMNLRKATKDGKYEEEGWRLRKDGSVFWAYVSINAIKDKNGVLLGFGNVTRDLNRRKLGDRKIEALNQQLELQLQKSQVEVVAYKHAIDESSIVAITDQKGIIKYVNENFCKISQFSRLELIGQDHRIINSSFHSKEFIRDIWTTIGRGQIWRGEIRNKAKDGSYYWVDTTIVPFLNEINKPYQYVAIRSDITARKNAEEEITKINTELERKIEMRTLELTEALERQLELSDMKSHFVSIASHEFRTPLGAILSSVSLLEHYSSPEYSEKRIKHIDRIKASVRNLTNILDDFLSLEKMEEKKYQVKASRFELGKLIDNVIAQVEGMLKKKKQTIETNLPGVVNMFQDEKILHSILVNLLSNAIKYSPEGKAIHISAKVDNNILVATIKDNGIGIPTAAQKHLFTRFFRAANATNIQGTGLGLNIVKNYIELIDGKISFVSKEGAGSTFTIELPQKCER